MDPNHLPVADSAPYHDALAQCVDHWGLIPEKTELIRDGVNHVFGSETRSGEPVIVRVTDGAIRERSELDGELIWLEHLIRHGCTVTTPIRSRNGEPLETIELEQGVFHVCCFERFGGSQINPRTDPLWNDTLFVNLGREIGRIHRATDLLKLPPEQDRKPWYECNLSHFPDPLPKEINPRVRDAMQSFTDAMRGRIQKPRHYGLIHRDLHSGNFLVEQGKIQVIDFDLGCYGWRAMDFSVLLFAHYYYPSLCVPRSTPELAGHVLACLARGYREEYSLDHEQLEMIGDLIKLREIVIYIATAPAVDHWQVAMRDPRPLVSESISWIEKKWLAGDEVRVDLSQVVG